jgi:hypothetical protein
MKILETIIHSKHVITTNFDMKPIKNTSTRNHKRMWSDCSTATSAK